MDGRASAPQSAEPALHASARSHRAADCRTVLMVGTDPGMMGGIASVVRGYIDGGLFERFPCRYVPTHLDGSAAAKAWCALKGWVTILVSLCTLDAPLMHVHLSSRASFWRKAVPCLLARAFGRPYILHVHGSEFMRFHDVESGPFSRRVIRSVLENAALVLALSAEWRANLLRIAPAARVEVLANAVPIPAATEIGKADPQTPVILFLGRLGERKGTFDLVRAFARVLSHHPQARLVCAGDGAIEEARALAIQLGVLEHVSCPGWLAGEPARQALAGASIFVLPSHAEGLPMALLEAMSWGLPVVTTPVGGIPQVVEPGVNGIFVSPGRIDELAAALTRLLDEPQLRARLGAAARSTIERNCSLEAALERLGAIYRGFGVPMRTRRA